MAKKPIINQSILDDMDVLNDEYRSYFDALSPEERYFIEISILDILYRKDYSGISINREVVFGMDGKSKVRYTVEMDSKGRL